MIAMTHSPARAVCRSVILLVFTLSVVVLFFALVPFGAAGRRAPVRLWCLGTARLLGLRLSIEGNAFRACPTLFVANHVSYLDIVVLGAELDATFVAKQEVSHWPLFGQLGKLTRTFFIRRNWRQALVQRNALAARMRRGESFVLFAEGTSSTGLDVLPFKSSLFSVAEPWVLDCPVAVQPVTIAFAQLADGTPIGADNAALYAWYGDEPFLPHLWQVLGMPGVAARVLIHEPVISWAVTSRKVLARQARAHVARGLSEIRRETLRGIPAGREIAAARALPVGREMPDLLDVPMARPVLAGPAERVREIA